MRWKILGGVVIATGVAVGFAVAGEVKHGPVVEELGPVVPTPAPSPESANRIRLISSFTLQNKPDGESVISFEATDFARSDKKQIRIIANEMYSLVPKKPEHEAMRERILLRIRDLERDLLDYVEKVGPPRERAAVTQQSGSQRPYR